MLDRCYAEPMAPTQRYLVDRLWPEPAADLEIDEAMADFALPAPPPHRPLVGINMITTVDGRAQLKGTAEGLGGRADRRLMRLYRTAYDAVGSGAGTLRAAGFWPNLPDDLSAARTRRGLAPQPSSVVIGGRSPLPSDVKWTGDGPRILIVGAGNEQEPMPDVELLAAPTPVPEPRWVLDRLAERGISSLLLEGGPTTNAAFLAVHAIDELYWSIGPKLVGTDALPMIAAIPGGSPFAEHPRAGRLISALRHEDELYLRYRFTG
jgi:2,5-diamino-6-(ribosylamino)-4(3H)-pyrimidinone 5'-phosphate reductase